MTHPNQARLAEAYAAFASGDLSIILRLLNDEVNWQAGCAEYARAARLGGATAQYLSGLAEAFQALARRLPKGGRALVVSHGGVIEAATVACLPDKDYAGWDASCDYCEGVRFHLVDGRFGVAEVLRVTPSQWL